VKNRRQGIALLITIMFVIVISVAIGYGLKQVNEASSIVKKENFMYQSHIIVEDVLSILKTSNEVKMIGDDNSTSELFLFLSQAAFIPFESSGLEIVMKISSARAKFNPLLLKANQVRQDAMRQYLNNYMVNSQYVDLLVDNISDIKEDNSYNSAIFDENPYLFRDYIASAKHLEKINDFYAKEFNDNSLSKVNFNNLFYYSDNNSTKVDLNYATTEVWEILLGTTKERAEFLSNGGGSYTDEASLGLNSDELERLNLFNIKSFFEPILFVELEISQNGASTSISFEYDIKEKKGSNFVYEL